MKNCIKIILFAIGVLALLFLIAKSDIRKIAEIISRANLSLVFLGLTLYLILVFARSLKWLLLAKSIKESVKYKEILPVFLANSFLGNITPLKSGGILSPFLFKKYLKIEEGQGFFVMVLDMLYELAVFFCLLFFSLLYLLNYKAENKTILLAKELLFLFVIIVIFSAAFLSLKKVLLKLFGFFEKNKIIEFLKRQISIFYDTFSLLKEKKIHLFLLLTTVIVWLLEVLSFYFIFSSVSPVFFLQVTSAQIIAAGATFLVFTPAGIGVAELSIFFILSIFGYHKEMILAGILLTRFLLTGTLLLIGFIGSLFLKEKSN